jgi:hypothetical protein
MGSPVLYATGRSILERMTKSDTEQASGHLVLCSLRWGGWLDGEAGQAVRPA